jgi:phage major head subunit gpT-like protein
MAVRSKKQCRRERRKALRMIRAESALPDMRIIEAEADSEFRLEAAQEGDTANLKRFSMLAYTGGPMRVAGYYYPVIVDLAGLKVTAKSRPILRDHSAAQIVGHTTEINIQPKSIRLQGVISAVNSYAQEVADSASNGFPWQASIGATPDQLIFLDRGETLQINGRTVTGPLYVARKATLKEVSFVALGADDNTSSRLEGDSHPPSKIEVITMQFEKWLKAKGFDPETLSEAQLASLRAMYDAEIAAAAPGGDAGGAAPSGGGGTNPTGNPPPAADAGPNPLQAMREEAAREAERIAAVNALTADHGEIRAQAIREGWDATRTELEVLRASRAEAPGTIHRTESTVNLEVLEASAMMSLGYDTERLEAEYTEQTLETAHRQFRARISLQQLIMECAWANGYDGRHFRSNPRAAMRAAWGQGGDILAEGFSTTSLPGLMSNVANKFLLMGFYTVESTWRAIAAVRPVNDFKTSTSYRLTGDLQYEEVGASGEIHHGKLGEESFTNQAKTFARMLALTRTDIINDDLGALESAPRRLGRGASLKICDVFWTAWLDNAAFFTAGNNNYSSGAGTALSLDALTAAELLFLNQTDPDGKPLGITPNILLVPNALNVTASNLMRSVEVRNPAGTEAEPISNPHAGKFRVERSSYLANAIYTGYSAAAWYLLADPADLPAIEVCFLNGVEVPTVETTEADFDTLGVQMRGFHDFGVSKQDHRAGVKMKGTA